MKIGGFIKFSSTDWPGKLSSVVFTRGCSYICKYCHNSQLRKKEGETFPWSLVISHLESRQGLLDGLVFSGGEPTEQEDLFEKIKEVKYLGFEVALHTNGANPEVLEKIVPLVSWVGLDFKAPSYMYNVFSGKIDGFSRFKESLRILQSSQIEYEIRTTVRLPLKTQHLPDMKEELKSLKVDSWMLQTGLKRPLGKRLLSSLQDDKLLVLSR